MQLYKILNKATKDWWYHKELRRSGQTAKARKLERAGIRRRLNELKNAVFFVQRAGGWTLHLHSKVTPTATTTARLSQGGTDTVYQQGLDLLRPEVPRMSTREMDLGAALSLPMFSDTDDEPREDGVYTGSRYCPAGILVACCEAFGGEVYWGDLNPEEWREKAAPTINHIRAKLEERKVA